jgi:hypothetical protein
LFSNSLSRADTNLQRKHDLPSGDVWSIPEMSREYNGEAPFCTVGERMKLWLCMSFVSGSDFWVKSTISVADNDPRESSKAVHKAAESARRNHLAVGPTECRGWPMSISNLES